MIAVLDQDDFDILGRQLLGGEQLFQCHQSIGFPGQDDDERKIAGAILTCWSLVHGLTQLMADGLVGPTNKSEEIGETLVQGMLDGLAAKLPAMPPGAWVGPQMK